MKTGNLKKKYKQIFKIKIDNIDYIYRPLNIGEWNYLMFNTLDQFQIDNFIVENCLVEPDINIKTAPAFLIMKLSECIQKISEFNIDYIKKVFPDIRRELKKMNDVDIWEISIIKAFPGYTFKDLDNMHPYEFLRLLARAEYILNTKLVSDKVLFSRNRVESSVTEEKIVTTGNKFMKETELQKISAEASTDALKEHWDSVKRKSNAG